MQSAQVAEHLVGECVDVADGVRLADHALGIDEVRNALGEVHLLGTGIPRAVGDADLLVVVRQQTEREVELVAEGLVLGRRVEADTEDLASERFVLLGLVTQTLALNRSTRGVGLWVPPQQHPSAALIGEPNRIAVLVGHVEVVRSRPLREHHTAAFSKMCTPHAEPRPMTCVRPTLAPSI